MTVRKKNSAGKNYKNRNSAKKSKKTPVTIITTIVVVIMTLLGWINKESLQEYLFSEYGIFGSEEIYNDELEVYALKDVDEILSVVPAFTDQPYVVINDNVPFFTEEEKTTMEAIELFSELDGLGRCGTALANVCKELMPTADREDIGQVKPSGWKTAKYDHVDGKYLYNRCHLIGFQLTGENANEKNLITGTRYMNVDGMLPFENMIDDYVDETENHVLYRVTPIYEGDELVARGVLMEAYSIEDQGEGICFNVYAYNNQPGVVIDYATGDSRAE